MDKLMESVFEWIMDKILNGVVFVVNFFAQLSTGQFGIETTSFQKMFDPNGTFLPQVIDIFMYTGVGLCLVMLCWNLFKSFFGPLASVRESPMAMAGKTLIAIFFSIKGIEIIETIVFAMLRVPYAELAGLPVDRTVTVTAESIKSISNIGDATSIVGDTFLTGSGIGWFTLFVIVLLIFICYKFFKLVIELIERYLLMNVLVFSSPLVGCTLISEKTSPIFNGFCKMLGGQMILMLFNVISMQLVSAGLSGALQNSSATAGVGESMGAITLNLFAVIALINVAQRFDTYLNQLGLNAGITGGEMLGRDMIPLMNMMNGRGLGFFGRMGRGSVGSAGKAAGNAVGKTISGDGAKGDVKTADKSIASSKKDVDTDTNTKTSNVHNGATAAERIMKNAARNQGAPIASTISNSTSKTGAVNNAKLSSDLSDSSTATIVGGDSNSISDGSTINSGMSNNELSNVSSASSSETSVSNSTAQGCAISKDSVESVSQSTNIADASSITNVDSGGSHVNSTTAATEIHSVSTNVQSKTESSNTANNQSESGAVSVKSIENDVSRTSITTPASSGSITVSQSKPVGTNSTTNNFVGASISSNKPAASQKLVKRSDMKK